MRGLILLCCVLVSGCVEELSSNDNVDPVYDYCSAPHDIEHDIVDESGLYVPVFLPNYSPTEQLRIAKNLFVKTDAIIELYHEIENCVGVPPTSGPQMWFVNFSDLGWGGSWGFTHYAGGIIAINTEVTDTNQRNCISDVDTLRHEYVHYITYMNGLDHKHGSIYFERCDAIGVSTCDGVPCRH